MHGIEARSNRSPKDRRPANHKYVRWLRDLWKSLQPKEQVRLVGRIPRISRLLALAHHCFQLVRTGATINQSELAHFGQISTTRMTQIMWLDNLAPDIQEEILFLPRTTQGRDPIKEADIRPIAKTLDWSKQRQMWRELHKAIMLSS
jgi:hypothetical protein